MQLTFAWTGVLTLGSLLLWALTWFSLPRPAALALWGAGYQENLSVPHNVYGWNTLQDLSKFAQQSSNFRWGGTWLRLEQSPTVISSNSPWTKWFSDFREPTLVLCIEMHGAADEDGPYLLCEDSSETTGVKKLRIEELLQRLQQLPEEKHKLLVLDATQVESAWHLGFLNNEFTRALIALDDQITKVPNLVVLCASNVNQRSWVSEEHRRTVFGHFLIEALSGAANDADGDGRINALELHDSVRNEVTRWTSSHRGAMQTPILLPQGATGAARARKIDLGALPNHYTPFDPQTMPVFTPPVALQEAWEKYEQLSSKEPWGFADEPALWREYQDVLLRYEELVRAGDSASAAVMQDRMLGLQFRMQSEHDASLGSAQNTLALWTATGMGDKYKQQAVDALNRMWSAAPADYADLWQKAIGQVDDDVRGVQDFRIGFYEALLDRVSEAPAKNLATAASIVEAAADPLRPRPAEIHFILMLNRYLPPGALQDSGGQRIHNAIEVRRLAERAAVGLQDKGYSYSEEVAPWIASIVEAGDAQRSQGEDLLFAAADDRAKADAYFHAARQSYDQALDRALQLQSAIRTLNESLERLPYYSRWVLETLLVAGDGLSTFDADEDAVLLQLEELWHETYRLQAQMDRQNPDEIYAAPAPTAEDPKPRSIVDRENYIQQRYQQIVEHYHHVEQVLADGKTAGDWHSVQKALITPPVDWQLRLKMLTTGRRKLRQQVIAEQQRQAAAMIQRTSSAAQLELDDITAANQRKGVMRSAHWRGRLALASLGRRMFVESAQPGWESFEQLSHRLEVFEVEEEWWRSLLRAGTQLGERWRWMPTQIEKLLRDAPRDKSQQAFVALRMADQLSRRIDGAQASALPISAAQRYRERRLSDLVLELAQRAYNGRWYDLDPLGEPYYRKVGLCYVADAQRLAPNTSAPQDMRDKLQSSEGLAIAPVPKLELTTERRVVVRYVLGLADQSADTKHNANSDAETAPITEPNTVANAAQGAGRKSPPAGFPVTWLTDDPKLHLLEPQQGQRIVRRLDSDHRQATILCTVESPALEAAEKQLPNGNVVDRTVLTLDGFFRGQLLNGRVPIDLHLRPETLVYDLPPADRANVSLVASASLQQQLGNGAGAVAFVLDCSGSMGPPAPAAGAGYTTTSGNANSQSKYAEAVAALQEVLKTVPAGVQVSVWLFGEAVGPDRTAIDPAATIRQVQPPIRWDPKSPSQLTALMARIAPTQVTPWNQSPIVRAILAAQADLANVAGYKTIVVITDGIDNTFANDPVANPNKQSIPAALTQAFQDSGVALNVVGFKVDSTEALQARQQFEVVEKLFPPGRFYQVDQNAALASVMSVALRHRLRYWMEPFDAKLAAQGKPRMFEIGNPAGGEYWFAEPLAPGTYKLRINADSHIREEVTLAPGDLLPLELAHTPYGLAVSQLAYLAKRYPERPSGTSGDWRAAVLNGQLLSDDRVQFTVSLEKEPRTSGGRLQQSQPRDIWIEAAPSSATDQPGALDWGAAQGYPTPTWSLLATTWPVDSANNAARPTVRLWWNPDQQTPLSGSIRRGGEQQTLEDLAGSVIQGVSDSVSIASVSAEQHYVEVAPGVRSLQPCLVVRLQHSPGKSFWARPQGVDAPGAEHRFYPSIGAYTGLFWPLTSEQAQQQLRGVGVVSLDVLKREAEVRGCTLQIGGIPAPQPGDVRPAPSVSTP